jgi:hypothetical protein
VLSIPRRVGLSLYLERIRTGGTPSQYEYKRCQCKRSAAVPQCVYEYSYSARQDLGDREDVHKEFRGSRVETS